MAKLCSMRLVHFVLPVQFVLTLAFDRVGLYGNVVLSILVLSTLLQFLKGRFWFFKKLFSKLRYWKHADLSSRGIFQKSFVRFLERPKVFLLVLKKPLRGNVFLCKDKNHLTFFVRFVEWSSRYFYWLCKHIEKIKTSQEFISANSCTE